MSGVGGTYALRLTSSGGSIDTFFSKVDQRDVRVHDQAQHQQQQQQQQQHARVHKPAHLRANGVTAAAAAVVAAAAAATVEAAAAPELPQLGSKAAAAAASGRSRSGRGRAKGTRGVKGGSKSKAAADSAARIRASAAAAEAAAAVKAEAEAEAAEGKAHVHAHAHAAAQRATSAGALLEGSVLGGMAAQMGQTWAESPGRAPPHSSWADSPRRMSPRRGGRGGGPWANMTQQHAESPRRGLEAYLCGEDLSDASSSPLSGERAVRKQIEAESSEDSNQGAPEPVYLPDHHHQGGIGGFDHQDLLGPDSHLFGHGIGGMPGMPGAASPMKPMKHESAQQQQQQQHHHPLRNEAAPGNFSQFAYYMKPGEGMSDMYDT